MDGYRPVDSRIEDCKDLETDVTGFGNKYLAAKTFPYREAIRSHMNLMNGMRPDLAFWCGKAGAALP